MEYVVDFHLYQMNEFGESVMRKDADFTFYSSLNIIIISITRNAGMATIYKIQSFRAAYSLQTMANLYILVIYEWKTCE